MEGEPGDLQVSWICPVPLVLPTLRVLSLSETTSALMDGVSHFNLAPPTAGPHWPPARSAPERGRLVPPRLDGIEGQASRLPDALDPALGGFAHLAHLYVGEFTERKDGAVVGEGRGEGRGFGGGPFALGWSSCWAVASLKLLIRIHLVLPVVLIYWFLGQHQTWPPSLDTGGWISAVSHVLQSC